MKRIIYYTTLAILLMTGCSKPAPAPEQIGGYIFFSQNVDTKAALINDKAQLNGQSIGVVGFQYPTAQTWDQDHKDGTLMPNVFYDDNGNIVPTETVTCAADGTGSYAPLQGWTNSKKYSFFAYYPCGWDNVVLSNSNGSTYAGGTPYIKYTMNTASAADFKASMVDVMNATAQKDKFQSGNIVFGFKHQLSSLGIKMTNASEGPITVHIVKVTVDNIVNDAAVIPLDGIITAGVPASAPYKQEEIPLTLTDTEKTLAPGASVEPADKLIFVPQGESAKVSLLITFKREDYDGHAGYMDTKFTPELTTSFDQSKKHFISIRFTDSTVEIGGAVSTEGWVTIPDVENSFN